MIPVNIAPLRNTPLGPEKPGPEGKPAPIRSPMPRGNPARPVGGSGVRMAVPATFRRGGRVKRTGIAKVHKGEHVIPAAASEMGAGKKQSKANKKARKRAIKAAKKDKP
jgi:hypothetical protein